MILSFLKKNHLTRHLTPRLAGAVGLICMSTLNYGFVNQDIATSQAMASYKRQFGNYNAEIDTWAIPTYWTSLLISLNFIGFAVG
jgi:hypothetical protein